MRSKVSLIRAKVTTHMTPEHSVDDGSGVSQACRKEIRIRASHSPNLHQPQG
jgi:hypothetical protein